MRGAMNIILKSKWYTKGSIMDTKTGAGVFELLGNFSIVFEADVHSIGRRIQSQMDRRYRNKVIVILSDTQAAIKTHELVETKYALLNPRLLWEKGLETAHQRTRSFSQFKASESICGNTNTKFNMPCERKKHKNK